jgi:hypothetical protein
VSDAFSRIAVCERARRRRRDRRRIGRPAGNQRAGRFRVDYLFGLAPQRAPRCQPGALPLRSRKKCKNSRRQPLQIDRGGRQISLDFHVGEAAPDAARKSVPCLGLAVKALRAPAMTLIEPKVFCGPALTAAASAERSGIMIANDNSFIDASFG